MASTESTGNASRSPPGRGEGTIISKCVSVSGPSFQLRWGKPAGMKTNDPGGARWTSSPSCTVMVPANKK
jgi:hypothetical protein